MFKCRKLYHFFVLLNIQGSLVHEVLLLVRVRVQYSRLRKRLRGRPLLARLLGGERHRDLQAVGPAATPRRIRVYFLKTKTHSRLEETFIVSDPSSEICWNCILLKTCHGFHLTVDHIVIKPAACILLWCRLKHLWFLCHPPRLSQAAPLKTQTRSLVADGAARSHHHNC